VHEISRCSKVRFLQNLKTKRAGGILANGLKAGKKHRFSPFAVLIWAKSRFVIMAGAVFLTMITTYGLTRTGVEGALVQNELGMDVLYPSVHPHLASGFSAP